MESFLNFEMPILKFYSPFRHFLVLLSADMEGKCCKCERVTKCLACFAQKFREDHDSYSKEEKLTGKCENCDGNQVVVKRKSDSKQ